MFCKKCGSEISASSTFCQSCGSVVDGKANLHAVKGRPSIGRYAAIVGGVMVAVGPFLPWATSQTGMITVQETGIERGIEGVYALSLGILIIVGACLDFRKLGSRAVLAVMCSGQALMLAVLDYAYTTGLLGDAAGTQASVSYGLWIVVGGAVLGLAGIMRNPAKTRPRLGHSAYGCPQCLQPIETEWEACPYCGAMLANMCEGESPL